jgi:beta-xylosidase
MDGPSGNESWPAGRTVAALFIAACLLLGNGKSLIVAAQDKGTEMKHAERTIKNPVIWSDVPDPDVIRVGKYFYMSSTTMHMTPGVPIMRSSDLANWEIVSYVYDILEDDDAHNLRNNKNTYGKGSWASSLRWHDGTFYVCFASYDTNKTYVYRTPDFEKGPWERSVFKGVYHDSSLLFDDDGRVYMVYGAGVIRLRELTKDASAFLPEGVSRVIITTEQKGNIVNAEGSHIYKINGFYYVFLIQWPSSGTRRRIEWCYRSRDLFGGYEGKIVLNDDLGYRNKGVAQGGIFEAAPGVWYAMLFQDHDAVGRVPVLVPVAWVDDWPVMGVAGKAPAEVKVPLAASRKTALVTSDDFSYRKNALALNWQWNHNPDNGCWSLTERPGHLRLKTGSTARNILRAGNTLTQRTEGPSCSAETVIFTAHMQSGDWAGLAAFQNNYGLIGVSVSETGEKRVVTAVNGGAGDPKETGSMILKQDGVYLRINFDFTDSRDKARFLFSLDGKKWIELGSELTMQYTLDHFMGYRIALFNYATQSCGGYVDFDYFHYSRNVAAGKNP